MTNNTQLVSVPRELLEEALSGVCSKPKLDRNYCCVGCGNWMPYKHPEAHEHSDECPEEIAAIERHWSSRLSAILAAPAEDVRAVVEEPVGYGAWNTGTNPGTRLMRYDGMVAISPDSSDFYKIPVYLNPQRPVVLPERKDPDNSMSEPYDPDSLNACLDAVEELNK